MHSPASMKVSHDKHCRNVKQTPIRTLDPSKPLSEALIRKVQKRIIRTHPEGDQKLPTDADTIPPLSSKTAAGMGKMASRSRHLSHREAIESIKNWELVLHEGEVGKRDKKIQKLLKDVFDISEYLVTNESYLTDFWPIYDRGCTYKKIAEKIEKIYGFAICPGCLYEARYLWRQIDVIEKYRRLKAR